MSHDAKDPIDFTEPWPYSDITFIVDTRKVFANKTVLTLWSPVFEAMFQHDFKEKAATEIDLPGKSFDGLMELMRVLHPPNTDICGKSAILHTELRYFWNNFAKFWLDHIQILYNGSFDDCM